MTLPEVSGNFFYYFGYGSNMLQKRIQLQNKSAVRIGLGKLPDWRLDFSSHSPRWKGAPATVVPTPDAFVFGSIWQLNLKDLQELDKQESVSTGMYTPISIPIQAADGKTMICRVYHLTKHPELLPALDVPPLERQPSATYLKVLVKGAIETGVPNMYLNFLRSIDHNGNIVEEFEKEFELENVMLKR